MRIIAGTAKGARLAPVPAGTRPVSGRAREGLFSSLGSEVEGARVLDLYAGTGALGIEALSRGAARATFVEREPGAVKVIRENLERTHLGGAGKVVRRSVPAFVKGPAAPADIVFLDPPYAIEKSELSQVVGLLASGEWLAGTGWTVVLTRPSGNYKDVVPVDWPVARRLVYGDTLVVLYREV